MINRFRSKALALALAAVILPACTQTTETTENLTQPQQKNVTAKDVTDNTDNLVGQTVTIRTDVINKISPATFAVTNDDFFGGDSILIVNATGETQPLPQGTELQITGEVQKFAAGDVSQKYKLELDSKDYQTFEGKPAIIAKSIALAPKPGQITTNPDEYYNKVIAVPGTIKNVTGNNVFVLEDQALIGADDLLILVPNEPNVVPPQQTLKIGETVVATGTLRQFTVADLERDYKFNWDTGVRSQLETDYNQKPVLIVDNIYPSALPNSLQK
ncbi:MAG: hypothetical protein IGS23_12050 [Rivularia sp. T60_A2020_040]|nr:hypothetical protein [Rivularia sp. T60_A2020_040]